MRTEANHTVLEVEDVTPVIEGWHAKKSPVGVILEKHDLPERNIGEEFHSYNVEVNNPRSREEPPRFGLFKKFEVELRDMRYEWRVVRGHGRYWQHGHDVVERERFEDFEDAMSYARDLMAKYAEVELQ